MKPALAMIGLAAGFAAALPAGAEELTGDVIIGWREISVSGSKNRYRQDLNLDDGARLTGLRLNYDREGGSSGQLPDLVDVAIDNLGGDPFENIHLGVRKFGAYDFRYDRRRSEYFYNDLIVAPGTADIEGSTGGDFHRFDFERVQDDMSLDVHFTPRATGSLNFHRYAKEGDSTTTRDVQRDEFELDQPVDELLQEVTAGFQYQWDRVTVALEERLTEYDNESELFLPGLSPGQNLSDPATLDFYFFDQPYNYDSNETRVRVNARPTDRIDLKFSGSVTDLDLELEGRERAQGIDFLGNPFTVDETGGGNVDRQMELYDLEGSFRLTSRLSAIAGVFWRRLDQDGLVDFGADGGTSEWEIETTGTELGLEWVALPGLVISGGWSAEQRDVDISEATGSFAGETDSDTDRDGYFVTVDYRPFDRLDLSASVEDNSYDDPFTLASPTDSVRYRFRGRYRLDNGLTLVATHKVNDLDNDNTGWSARTEQTDVRISHVTDRLQLSAGASFVDQSRDFDALVTGGFRQDLISVDYRGDTTFYDGRIAWEATQDLTVGGNYRIYDNDGSFEADRDDREIFADYALPGNYRVRLSYRNVAYDEDLEDYEADILELGLGMSF